MPRILQGPATLALLLAIGCATGNEGGGGGGPASISLVPKPATVQLASTLQVVAVVKDSTGATLTNQTLAWSSSDSAVARVSNTGVVTGVAVGSATITASVGPVQGSTTVSVVTTLPSGTLLFSSFFGGTDEDIGRDIELDAAGDIYACGNTHSPDFPVTAGAYSTTYDPASSNVADAWVAKFTSSGQLVWSTFLGGPNYERCYGLELDPQGNVIVVGRGGDGLPGTAGTFQPTFGGGPVTTYGQQDGFVCKLNSSGSTLIFCSYFGTNDAEIIRDVAVDDAGDIYVAAGAEAGGFPAAWFTNAFQPQKAAGLDIVVAKIESDGSQVLWATYLGGNNKEVGTPSIRVDASRNVYVLAGTNSTNLPTPNGNDGTLGGGEDMYLAKLSSNGSSRLFGTYIGGSGDENSETHGLALDAQGNIFVAAATNSSNFPTTTGAFQRVLGGVGNVATTDAFVTKFSPSGVLLASTLLGGLSFESAEGVATDPQGNLYFSGVTGSAASFPGGVGIGPRGNSDFVLVKMSPDLGQLLFSVTLGGSQIDFGRSAIVSPSGALYAFGVTRSVDYPASNAAQPTYHNGGVDAALVGIVP